MRLPLELLLLGLATILRRSAEKPLVKAKLGVDARVVQIRTQDGGVGRYFVFCGGAVFSRRGVASNPDVSLVWKDATVAAGALLRGSSDAIPEALANGSLSIVGDPATAVWFGELVRLARGGEQPARAAKPPVSVIGLGRMGSGIARSLLRAGFPVTVYNRTEDKVRPLVEAGAMAAATPAAAARAGKFIITSLMGDASVSAVVEGPEGLLAGLERDGVHIGASTISAEATSRLVALHAAHGSEYLAAPVLGRPDAAASGELASLVCGKQSVFETSREVLRAYTRQVQYLGEQHAVASEAKLAMNYTAVTIIDLMGQVYAFGENTGIPLAALHMMFRMLWAQPVMQGYATRIWKREFGDVGFDVRGGLKDVNLMLDAAKKAHVRWDFAAAIQPKLTRAVEMGLGTKDWSAVYEVTRADADLVD